jgi:hypothetical protein
MLIKYYGPKTCYDGRKEFTVPLTPEEVAQRERHYPDEWLIAHILQIYIEIKRINLEMAHREVIVLKEPWQNSPPSEGSRANNGNGAENTIAINDLILSTISELKEEQKEFLILVPFLYGYHHPGIAILIKPGVKKAIYIDPFGDSEKKYQNTLELSVTLKGKKFDFSVIKTPQQQYFFDSTSCGPILTASMMEFIDEFIEFGDITGQNFQAPRPNLAIDRIKQIAINNSYLDFFNIRRLLVNELMLANTELWEQCIKEQHVSKAQKIIFVVRQQMLYIERLPVNWQQDGVVREEVASICRLQSTLINALIKRAADEEIMALLEAYELPNENEPTDKFKSTYKLINRLIIAFAITLLIIFAALPEFTPVMIIAAVLSIMAISITIVGPIFAGKNLEEIEQSVDVAPFIPKTTKIQQSCYPIFDYVYELSGFASAPNLKL